METIYEEEPYWEEIKRNSATSTQVLPQTQSAKKQPEKNQPTLA